MKETIRQLEEDKKELQTRYKHKVYFSTEIPKATTICIHYSRSIEEFRNANLVD